MSGDSDKSEGGFSSSGGVGVGVSSGVSVPSVLQYVV